MKTSLRLSRRARWVVPGGLVAIAAAVTAGSVITVAQAAPELPARSPAQLLAAVAGHIGPLPAMTGTVVETASLGIPDLPGTSNPTSITSLLTGSHTIKVWYGDPKHIRLAVPVSLSETDVIRNGSTVWMWQSQSNAVTKVQLPAKAAKAAKSPQATPTPTPTDVPLTPQQAAQQVLAAVGPTTTVTVDPAATVAGQAAYQLVLAPKSSSSLIGRVTIALDGQHMNVPLRVQVFAKGATAPAFQVGYTSIDFTQPAAANFSFTPPPGAKVTTESPMKAARKTAGSPAKTAADEPQVLGQDWLSVAVLPYSALPGIAGNGNAASVAGQAAQSAAAGPGGGSGAGVEIGPVIAALLRSATPVHGAWGSGRLLHTGLVSILILNGSGKVLVGSVTPAVLYSDAAQVK
jgi:outer membrane lipoprotein-sorting protein